MANILLADDDAAMRDFIRRALEADGHKVTARPDGQEALDALLAGPAGYDLLITDVQMPSLDGISLTRQAVAAAPGLRVMLMSGFVDELSRAKGIQAARLTRVTKPFTLEQLRTEVRAMLA